MLGKVAPIVMLIITIKVTTEHSTNVRAFGEILNTRVWGCGPNGKMMDNFILFMAKGVHWVCCDCPNNED
jgi:hypothetical protein